MVAFYTDIKPEDLPVPNHHIIQLIQYTLKDDAEIDILSQLIEMTPSLTAKILGLVNSPYFGFREEISLISNAIVAIGMDNLKNLVLCFSMKEALSQKPIEGFDIDSFWEDSIRRGVAAKHIVQMANRPFEEAFTTGMLLDIGLLVLFIMEPEKVDRWPSFRMSTPKMRHEMEKELFDTTHDGIGALLATKWSLPESYIQAIGYHHLFFNKEKIDAFGKIDKSFELAGVMHLSDLCNSMYTCYNKLEILTTLKQKAKTLFNFDEDDVDTLLSILPKKVKEISEALQVSVGPQEKFENIMEEANKKLTKNNKNYQELTWQLQTALKQRDEYSLRLRTELEVGKKMQSDFLPQNHFEDQHVDISSYFQSALQLSGDFYDIFTLPNNYLGFVIGDVSDKGVGSALFMALTRSLLRIFSGSFTTANFLGKTKAVDKNFSPKDALKAMPLTNEYLSKEHSNEGMFVTVFFCVLDTLTGKMSYINAGHEPVLVVGKEGLKKHLKTTGPAIGAIQGAKFKMEVVQLEKDDIFFGYTDGVTEARSNSNALYSRDRLIKILKNGYRGSTSNFMDVIKTDLFKFTKNAPQSDDITMLAVEWQG